MLKSPILRVSRSHPLDPKTLPSAAKNIFTDALASRSVTTAPSFATLFRISRTASIS